MRLDQFRQEATRLLMDSPHFEEAVSVVDFILCARLEVTNSSLRIDPSIELSVGQLHQLNADVARLRMGEPMQYVLGHAWFDGLRLNVDSRVLIPRPETEELVQRAHAAFPEAKMIVDLCSGSGCIALACKQRMPSAEVFAVELDSGALEVIRMNADRTGLSIGQIQADVLEVDAASLLPGDIDLLISNPPYVLLGEAKDMSALVLEHEPHLALFVPDTDPLIFYRSIATLATRMASGGQIWLEVNPHYASAVSVLFQAPVFSNTRVHVDLSGKQRFVSVHKS
ncbi:MAG: peptide chain release factor N(5)-glutamine methyltransferase [Bacteroidota bacterium]